VFPEGPVAEVEKSGGFAAIAGHTPAAVGDAATTSR
jgi:hypothetical protein